MDIRHFSYFVAIVECGCNLSTAAKNLHVSQSALSKIILTLEQEENQPLFLRSSGRLSKLTAAGEIFYAASRDISSRYERMLEELRAESKKYKGEVRIGIPPLILTVVFADIITRFKGQFPHIELSIVEAGAEDLRQKLLGHEIDFAVLLSPTGLDSSMIEEHVLCRDELAGFVSTRDALAKQESIAWQDLNGRDIAIFNESFTINRLVTQKVKQQKIKPTIALTSSSWDFLLGAVQSSNYITILPAPILDYTNAKKVKAIPFADPIMWEVILSERRGQKLSASQKVFRRFVLS